MLFFCKLGIEQPCSVLEAQGAGRREVLLMVLIMQEDQTRVSEPEQKSSSSGKHTSLSQTPLVCSMKPHTVMEPPLLSQGTWHYPARLVTKAQADWKRGFFSGWWQVSACCAVFHTTYEMN